MKCTHRFFGLVASAVILFAFLALVAGPQPVLAQSIQVLSANPNTAEQGTVNLNVVIKGKGFKRGAKAKFYKTGTTELGGVQVNSTTFTSSTEVVANIDVAVDAAAQMFDIEVMNSDGRGGKGTELFSVTKKQTACVVPPPPEPTGGYCFASEPRPGIAGCLDTNFGGGAGRVMTPRELTILGVATQQDDGEAKIIAVGETRVPCGGYTPTVWTVVRYHADGSVDTSFGPDGTGIIKMESSNGMATATSVVVQADSRVLVAGHIAVGKVDYLPTFARYTADGLPDPTFGGGDGLVTVPYGRSYGWADAIALQSDGKIVAAGSYGFYHLAVMRLNANGTLDTTFHGTGQYVHNANSVGRAITVQTIGSEERIVVAGRTLVAYPSQHNNAVLMRFTSGGALDTSFGGSGIVLTEFFGYYSDYFGVARDSSNRLVAVAQANPTNVGSPPPTVLAMARYDQWGNLDTTFGNGTGWVSTAEGANAIAIQPDGLILVVGSSSGMAIWRFQPDGQLDTSWGGTGLISETFTIGGTAGAYALVLQADGKFVVAGRAQVMDGTNRFGFAALARFWK